MRTRGAPAEAEPAGGAVKKRAKALVTAIVTHRVETTEPKRKRRRKSGVKALQEIKKLQKTAELLIPKAAFARYAKELVQERCTGDGKPMLRMSKDALLALQEAAEAYGICIFEGAQKAAIHAKRITVMQKDFQLTRFFRGEI